MNWYKDHKLEWKEIIKIVSSETKKTFHMIEKDVIQSMFLYELTKSELPFVFKGGTSLSKAFNLIDRFSEDIDLSTSRKLTGSEKKKSNLLILQIGKDIGLEIYNEEEIKSGYDYNKYIFNYNSLLNDEKLEIIVETNYYYPVFPVVKHNINSFVITFLEKNNLKLPFNFIEGQFDMNVQSLERTFIDKVFAVCDYKIQNMMDRDSRHLYDIAKIYPHIQINNELIDLIKIVRSDRMKSKNNPSAQPEFNINKLLKDIIDTRFFEKDFNFITKKLLYEDYSYERSIDEGIKKVLKASIF